MSASLRWAPAGLLAVLVTACGDSTGYDISRPFADHKDDVDRSIDVSTAVGPLPLDTPDDGARAAIGARLFYSSVIDTLVGGTGDGAKASVTENCADGGWRTEDKSTTRRAVRYENCLEGFRFLDGFLLAEITGAGYPWSDARAQIGEDDVPLLGENRDPAHDTRSLALGTLTGGVKIDFRGDVEEIDAVVNLKGLQSNLDGPPAMRYAMDSDRVNVQFDGSDLLIDESGNFRIAGDCGEGQASVATPRRLRVNQDTGAVSDGQITVSNASGQSATITFNADQSIDVTAGAASAHFTRDEFEALCPF
jgi:hypothetical protein